MGTRYSCIDAFRICTCESKLLKYSFACLYVNTERLLLTFMIPQNDTLKVVFKAEEYVNVHCKFTQYKFVIQTEIALLVFLSSFSPQCIVSLNICKALAAQPSAQTSRYNKTDWPNDYSIHLPFWEFRRFGPHSFELWSSQTDDLKN